MAARKGGKGHNHQNGHSHDEHKDHNKELMKMEEQLDEQELEHLYAWVDSIPLSRPKKNIARDFSDGVLVAELLQQYFPHLVEMHNYTPCSKSDNKAVNWNMLNRKVFKKLSFELAEDVINDLVCCKPGMIEKVLLMLQVKIKRAEYARQRMMNEKPEADQHHSHVSPGRKDGKLVKIGMEDTKGSRFAKTKQPQPDSKSQSKIMPPSHYKKRVGTVAESDVVPRYLLEEKEQDILARDETIQMLNRKVKKLDYLIHLKDRRIEDLHDRLDQLQIQQRQYHHHHQDQTQSSASSRGLSDRNTSTP